jgi:hypothetical protein
MPSIDTENNKLCLPVFSKHNTKSDMVNTMSLWVEPDSLFSCTKHCVEVHRLKDMVFLVFMASNSSATKPEVTKRDR